MSEVVKGWKPTAEHLRWAANHLAMLKDGGIWGCTHGVYRIDHKARTCTLLLLTPFANNETWRTIHGRSYITFKALGYKVLIGKAAWKERN